MYDIHRRHHHSSTTKNRCLDGKRHIDLDSTSLRLNNKFQEKHIRSKTSNRIPRVDHRLSTNENHSTTKKSKQDCGNVRKNVQNTTHNSEGNEQSNGKISKYSCSSDPISSVSEKHATSNKESIIGKSIIRGKNNIGRKDERRIKMVERKHQNSQWQTPKIRKARYSSVNRCIIDRLGGTLQDSEHRGSVDIRRVTKSKAHKRAGKCSSIKGNQDILQDPQTKINTFENRQYVYTVLHHKTRRKEQSNYEQNNQRDLGVHVGEKLSTDSRVHTISKESRSRLREQKDGCIRMETESHLFQQNMSKIRTTNNRPLCILGNETTTKLCELQTRSIGHGNRCIPDELDKDATGVLFSAFQTNRESIEQNQRTPHFGDHDYSSVGDSNMVSNVARNDHRTTNNIAKSSRLVIKSSRTATSINKRRANAISGMESLRKQFQNKGIPKETAELMLKSRSEGTTKNYESAFTTFSSWCSSRSEDPFSCNLKIILCYLTELYLEGREYRTINNHRSAISLYHEQVDGVDVGKHIDVRTLLKGISKERPPAPNSNEVWDIKDLLQYIRGLESNMDLKITVLAQKTVTLIAIVSIARVSEIHKLDLKFMIAKSDHLIFQIPGTVKHSRQGKQNPPLIIHKYTNDKRLCPMQSIIDYIERTKEWRKEDSQSKLFLTSNKTHTPISKTTISNYIKHSLNRAGISSKFTAHSTRSSASSKAKKCLSIDVILKRGNWSRESTFETFYNKPVDEGGKLFQQEVLKL